VIGTVGSGKTTLLNLLGGLEKQSSGIILYENNPYEKNWYGKIIPKDDLFYVGDLRKQSPKKTVSAYIADKFGKKKKVIANRYFNDGSFKNLLHRTIKNISDAEANWLSMVLAIEADPRVLLIDDYGTYFNSKMEKEFRTKIIKMNRNLGTTIILTAPSDIYIKYFASVLIFLDHGHIWKIRSGSARPANKNRVNTKKRGNSKGHNRRNRRAK